MLVFQFRDNNCLLVSSPTDIFQATYLNKQIKTKSAVLATGFLLFFYRPVKIRFEYVTFNT